jgi:hypothetical protein
VSSAIIRLQGSGPVDIDVDTFSSAVYVSEVNNAGDRVRLDNFAFVLAPKFVGFYIDVDYAIVNYSLFVPSNYISIP